MQDRLQEIIHPAYSRSAPFLNMEGYRQNYVAESTLPNNNDLYALMELTKNSGIKEVETETGKLFLYIVVYYGNVYKNRIDTTHKSVCCSTQNNIVCSTTLFSLDKCVVTPLFNQQCRNHLCYFSCVEKACIFVYFAFSKYLMLVLINVFQLHSSTA